MSEVDHPDWVPTLSMGYGKNNDHKIKSKVDRYMRLKKRESKPTTVKIGKAYSQIEVSFLLQYVFKYFSRFTPFVVLGL